MAYSLYGALFLLVLAVGSRLTVGKSYKMWSEDTMSEDWQAENTRNNGKCGWQW